MTPLGPIEEQLALIAASASIGGGVALAACLLASSRSLRLPSAVVGLGAPVCGLLLGAGLAGVALLALGISLPLAALGLGLGSLGLVLLPRVVERSLVADVRRRSARALAVVARRLESRGADERAVARAIDRLSDAARAA